MQKISGFKHACECAAVILFRTMKMHYLSNQVQAVIVKLRLFKGLVISRFYDLEGELLEMNGNREVVLEQQKKNKLAVNRDDLIELAVFPVRNIVGGGFD